MQMHFYQIHILRHIQIHKDKMADTSAHNEQMKDFMRTEVLMSAVKNWQFQRIDNPACRIDDAARQEPKKSRVRQCIPKRSEDTEAHPSHSNV